MELHAKLNKRHTTLSFHGVREAIDSGMVYSGIPFHPLRI
jgi:hypothetical protein